MNSHPGSWTRSTRNFAIQEQNTPFLPSTVCSSYIKGTSKTVSLSLWVSTLRHINQCRPSAIFYVYWRIVPPKEKIQGLRCRIPCGDCPAPYVKETQNFSEWLRRHQWDFKKKDMQGSTLAEHTERKNHTITFKNSTILEKKRNWWKCLLLEFWHIHNTQGNVNQSAGTLASSYISELRWDTQDTMRKPTPKHGLNFEMQQSHRAISRTPVTSKRWHRALWKTTTRTHQSLWSRGRAARETLGIQISDGVRIFLSYFSHS